MAYEIDYVGSYLLWRHGVARMYTFIDGTVGGVIPGI